MKMPKVYCTNSAISLGCLVGALFIVAVALAGAQSGPPDSKGPSFEVVSVKPSGSTRAYLPANTEITTTTRGFRYSPAGVTCDLPLLDIVQEAYSIDKAWQISAPDWLTFEKYELAATMPSGTNKETAREMLRRMLSERFRLKVHRDRKEMSGYILEIASAGSQLHEVPSVRGYEMRGGAGQYSASAIPLGAFVDQLARIAGRPVVDTTGLQGTYKIELHWTPNYEEREGGGRIDRGMLTVLESQLGLRLRSRKLPIEILVVDQVEKTPTPN